MPGEEEEERASTPPPSVDDDLEDLFGGDDDDDVDTQLSGPSSPAPVANEKAKATPSSPSQDNDIFGSDDDAEATLGDDALEVSTKLTRPPKPSGESSRARERDDDDRRTGSGASVQEFYENPHPPVGARLIRVRLPNILAIQPRPFDAISFADDEDAEMQDLESRGGKVGLENVVRWRLIKDKSGALKPDSNARIVRWSDGSMHMFLGSEVLEVEQHNMDKEHAYVYSRSQPAMLACHGKVGAKMTLRPVSTKSKFHSRLTKTMAETSKKVTKVKLVNTTADPEKEKEAREKMIEESIRLQQREDNERAAMYSRYNMTDELSTQFLERGHDEYDDDENDDEEAEAEISEEDERESRRDRHRPSAKRRRDRDDDEDTAKLLQAKSGSARKNKPSKDMDDFIVSDEEAEEVDDDAAEATSQEPSQADVDDDGEPLVRKRATKKGRPVIDDDDDIE
eukprot:TRINITY_DN5264_c0_g1_i4.p1 TRINITY_DN5264_c0_g1~~TRINITY_DN5264_c0_g1_i4.p1  ORF type:complete len:461 (-),score=139.96 TRINITY_DN5264_c0_g1_i4:119-1480(-)